MNLLKTSCLLIICLLFSQITFAQSNITFGSIIDKVSKDPIPEATISIPELRIITSTDVEGKFSFVTKKTGDYEAIISTDGFNEFKINIAVGSGRNTMDPIELEVGKGALDLFVNDITSTSLQDAGSFDDGGSSGGQNIASVLNAARDPFLSASTFGWGQFFYSIRGLESDQHAQFINGIPMNDMDNGRVDYNSYGGLNDVFRGRSFNLGLEANDYAFGGYGLNSFIDASASAQRAQTRVSYASTNRNYRNRLMLTHSSGLNKNGWAYSFSLSRRWANQGVIKGTFYDAYGVFAAVEKKYKKHDISLLAFGTSIKRGKNGPATTEASQLAGTTYYNPYWGYQNGEVRNSRVFNTNRPMFILSDKWDISSKTQLNAAASYQFGERSTTTFDWYNAPNPKPDYYRYLPSWSNIAAIESGFSPAEAAQYEQEAKDLIQANPDKFLQVDWNKLYEANNFSKQSGDGRAVYILGEDVNDTRKVNANVNVQHELDEHITLNAGLLYQSQRGHYFKRVNDLLGADYWLNINQFAERDFRENPDAAQLNLNNPNEKVGEGDLYGYNYNLNQSKASLFGQATFKFNRIDFFLTGELGNTNIQRDGHYKSGLYPTGSFGKSEKLSFGTYRLKGGVTYKINGRNYLYANAAIGTKAPFAENVFISARTRNQLVSNPQVEKIQSAEAGYLLRSPNFRTRISGYVTEVQNSIDITRFYEDDSRSFFNVIMQGVNKRSLGLELSTEIKLSPALTLSLAGNVGQAFYANNPTIKGYSDNDPTLGAEQYDIAQYDTAYINNFSLATGPQTAFNVNLFYRSKKYWFGSISANYIANKYIDIATPVRSVLVTDMLDRDSEAYTSLVEQEVYDPFMTFNAFVGKSLKLNKYIDKASDNMFLFFNLGLNNILNKQDIELYGFENARQGVVRESRTQAFPSRYAYTLGFQYYLNIAFTF